MNELRFDGRKSDGLCHWLDGLVIGGRRIGRWVTDGRETDGIGVDGLGPHGLRTDGLGMGRLRTDRLGLTGLGNDGGLGTHEKGTSFPEPDGLEIDGFGSHAGRTDELGTCRTDQLRSGGLATDGL